MKFIIPAIVGGAILASAAKDSAVAHPSFKPYTKKLADTSFFEQFDDSTSNWKVSNAKKDGKLSYKGEWEIEESTVNIGFKGDKGLVVKSEAALHAISVPLPKVFDNKDNTLVLQYEVKLQKGLECGGAYIKLLDASDKDQIPDEFSSDTSYQVMFGPDKCGNTNRVHFIIRRKNPKSGEYEEKALKVPPMAKIVRTSVLYTLIIKPTQEFEIRINGDVVRSGSLLDEHYFDIDPPKTIPDPADKKPEDWVDSAYIKDPNATKPEDWDEKAPYMIPDPKAKKPTDWDEATPKSIPDPDAKKPSYWDDEEDGEWEAPLIPNKECNKHGCGPWEAPKVRNPKFRGKWSPPMVPNPAYKGAWEAKQIPNVNYFHDERPSDLEPIGALGFELWTMTNSILFDDIYLGHSIKEAEEIGNATFLPKLKIERKISSLNEPTPEHEPEKPKGFKEPDEPWYSKLFDTVLVKVVLFLQAANGFILSLGSDPIHTLYNRPGEAVLYSSVFLSVFSVVYGFWSTVLYLITGGASAGNEPVEVETEKDEKQIKEEAENIESNSKPAADSEKNETKAVKRKN